MDCSLPGSSVHGIFQARILEWVAMPSSRGSSQPRDQTQMSHVSCIGSRFFTTSSTWKAQFSSVQFSRSVVSNSLWPHGLKYARLLCPWDFPGKNTGVGCHFLLQGIFPTQGSNPGLLHCRQTLYPLSHQGSSVFGAPQIKSFTVSPTICHEVMGPDAMILSFLNVEF